jgi:hypothetical protein
MHDSLDDGLMPARKGPRKNPTPSGSVGPGEFVVYPGVPTGIYDLLERLSAAAGDSPDSGNPAISLDRARLTVRWFGALPPAVQAVIDSAGTGFQVVVQPTEYRPGDLRAEAERLAVEHPGLVAAANPRPEGDGIDVLVPPAFAEAAGGPEQALAGVASVFRLFAEIGEIPTP